MTSGVKSSLMFWASPIIISDASDQGLWGAACIGKAALTGKDPCEIAKRDEAKTVINPDLKKHMQYGDAYNRYLAIINASKPIWDLPNSGEFENQ